MAEDELLSLCETSAVNPEMPLRVEAGGETYAVFQVDGRYYVTQDMCTHGPGQLSDGFVEGHEVECSFHQGRFDIRSGRPTAPPCTDALRVWPVRASDGTIKICPAEGRIHED